MKGLPRAARPCATAARGPVLWALVVLTYLPPSAVFSQSVAQRTPNMSTMWTPVQGVVQLNFTHRFDISDAPLRKITNTPGFHVATGVAGPVSVGFVYGSNSDLVPAYPNEWEWFTRWSALSQEEGAPLDAFVQAGWNVAAESFDSELGTARDFGPLRLLLAGRAFHHAFYAESARYAVAGGAALRLLPWLSIAADYATLIDRAETERPVWGAGLQLSVPTTPHSISIHAGNVGTGSLEGASRGSFERQNHESMRTGRFTLVPFLAALLLLACSDHSDPTEPVDSEDVTVVAVRDFAFVAPTITIDAGKSVRWSSTTGTFHTITPDGHQVFAERQMNASGAAFEVRFDAPGRYRYFCSVHRSLGMTGEVVVR